MVMILADSAIAVVTLGLAALFLTGRAEYWHLYAAALLRSTLGVFHWTAMQASTTLLVPREQLTRVAGLNQTLTGILNIAAPPLGALVVSLMPIGQIMLIDVTTAILAITPLLFIRIPQPMNTSTETVTPRSVLRDVAAGFRYLRALPGMMIILGVATMINFLLNPTGTLTPLLVTRHFNGGAWHLSGMESAWGGGIIAGGLLLSVWGGFNRHKIVTSMLSLALTGAAVLMVGLAPGNLFVLALAGNALNGLLNPLVNGPLFALLQDTVAPDMQGRVFSLVGSLAGAMSPLGMALAAPVADHLGIQVWWWIGGAFCLVMGISMFFIPAVMGIEKASGLVGKSAAVPPLPAD